MFFFVSSIGKKLTYRKTKIFSKNYPKMSQEVKKLANFMAGQWTNKKQATEFPSNWSHIQVSFYPLEYSFLNAFSFYTESANEYSLDEPYKTGILTFEKKGEIIEAKTFSIIGPEDFWYGAYEPSLLENLTKERIIASRNACDMEFRYDSEKDLFKGLTKPGKQCIIPREGKPTYLDSTILIDKNEYSSLDIGRNPETDELVWGPKAGPFVFSKKKTYPISNQ
mmetsp:Transcript_76/g.238  ORF Transcript_76/g.238 Transcript_76/m.238 type:complete len:223 (+) Transcript_76:26-694(+)